MRESRAPSLCWPGKTDSVAAVPAQLRHLERHGADLAHANRLIGGDNLAVMAALLPELEGRIDLIYLDPPFATGADWDFKSSIGCHRGVTDGPTIAQLAYSDVWTGLDAYLDMLWPRFQLAYRLLAPTGSLFAHVGWQVNSHVRLLLDEIFGGDRLLDEIVWHYQTSSGAPSGTLLKNHGTIFHYAKGSTWTFEPLFEGWPTSTLRKWQQDEDGRIYRRQSKTGKRYYADPRGKRADDVWEATLASRSHERTGYPTQKPEVLLERVIAMASRPGDIVADFFCGSGTTPAVANRLGRRWLACDSGARAVQTTRRRLAQAGACFDVFEDPGLLPGWALGHDSKDPPALHARLVGAREGRSWKVELENLVHQDRESWPQEAQRACLEWHDAIAEWEVDWRFDGSVFRPGFASRRTRKDRSLVLSSPEVTLERGLHRVEVRAIDFRGAAAVWRQEIEVP